MRAKRHLLAIGMVLTVAGCGVGAQGSPRALDVRVEGERIPFGLAPSTVVDAEDAPRSDAVLATTHFLDENGDVIPVPRALEPGPVEGQLEELLRSLISGPADEETALGLRSAVPSTTRVIDVRNDHGAVVVDLSSDLASIGGREELLAVGQIVLTVVTFPGVRSLRIHLDGEPVDVPRPDGALSSAPATLEQFSSLLQRAEATPGDR